MVVLGCLVTRFGADTSNAVGNIKHGADQSYVGTLCIEVQTNIKQAEQNNDVCVSTYQKSSSAS